ncbi:MAG TPA: DNA primase, partial [Bdellovibrionales bacterium]|nr:DNA primase [Bdellovibrionales bacterium]
QSRQRNRAVETAMRFSPDFIDKVRDATNIVEIISQHTQLKRSGSGYTGLCPFPDHKEKTASFSVSDTKQAFYCFGCKRGGNVYTFLRHYQGLPFAEAVEMLAERANIPLPQNANDKAAAAEDERRKQFLRLNRDAAIFYHEQLNRLPSNHPVRQYIRKRGLSDATIETFMLGYAPDAWSALAEHLKHKKPLETAEGLGLVRPRKGTGFYDVFRNRLMFPIISPVGEVLGFGGRVFGNDTPKYLNSSDSPVFTKGRVFYGLNESSKYIRAEDAVVVVEGYMDFLALYQAGVRNVVATLGTALTEEHARVLKRYTRNVVVLFDGDAAGQAAAERSLPILLKAELLPRGFALPEQLDPDEYVQREGPDRLKAEISAAPDLFVSYISRLIKKFGGRSTDKVRFMEAIKPVLLQITDERLRDLYIEEISSRLGVPSEWVRKSLKGQRVEPMQPKASTQAPQSTKIPSQNNNLKVPIPNEERLLLGLALMRESYLTQLIAAKVDDLVTHPHIQELLSLVIQRYGQRPSDFDKLASILSSEFDDPSLLTQHLDPKLVGLTEEQGKQLLRDCIQKVKQRFLKSQAKAIINELKTQTDPQKLEQFVNILRDRKALEKE